MDQTLTMPFRDNVAELTPAEIARVAEVGPMAVKWIAAALDETRRRLGEDPASVPGWVLAPGQKRRAWVDPGAVPDALRALGINDPYTQTLKTVAAVEKELGGDLPPSVAELIEINETRPTLKKGLTSSVASGETYW